MSCVYLLVDPRDNKPFYVGSTEDPIRREQQWNQDAVRVKNAELALRLIELRLLELRPEFVIIESNLARDVAYRRERYWIRLLRQHGHELLNMKLK